MPTMQRRHYNIVAQGLHNEWDRLKREQETGLDRNLHIVGVTLAVNSLIEVFGDDNPNFDGERFRRAVMDGVG